MRVLSLFDGMACGKIAFATLGAPIENYAAYEIDKYAIKTALHNFPEIEECGDVFEADFKQYEGVDWLIGGSPCTYWSITQSPDKRETTASGIGWELFSQYVRALHEAKPRYFLYENNKSMAKAIYQSISETFGFEPIMINSALVSAQNRQRYYWVGIRQMDGTYAKADIKQPEDRGILLKDVLNGITDRDVGRCVMSSCGRTTEREYFKKNQGNMTFESVGVIKDGKSLSEKTGTLTASSYKGIGADGMYTVSCADGKTYIVYEVKNGQITIKEKTYPIKLADGYYIIRKLTVSECKRLQTVPEWYEFPVSNTQAYKMLGNGWTVDVIAHIIVSVLRSLPVEERPFWILSFTEQRLHDTHASPEGAG